MERRFEIEVPAPFRLDLTVWALRRRAHNQMDRFDDGCWRRVLVVAGRTVEMGVTQVAAADRARLAIEVSTKGSPRGGGMEEEVRRIVSRCLGLELDLRGFYRLAESDGRLTSLASMFYGMRPPRFPSVFEALVNAIACQQLSLTVGIHLLNRLSAGFGPTGPGPEKVTGFPTPERLAEVESDALRALGFSGSKARAICALAWQVAAGELNLEGLEQADDTGTRQMLLGIGGVGRWSAEYTMLRGLGRLHVLPGDDVGARNNLRRRFDLEASAGYDELTELSRSWWPYGGLVYFHLLLDALAAAGEVAASDAGPQSEPSFFLAFPRITW